MRCTALVCDYDGALAAGPVPAQVRAALAHARATGLRLVLVTARTLFDLLRACPDLDLFDAAVAENGGVLYFPAEALIRDDGPPPAPALLRELDRRAIGYETGRVVVTAARGDAADVEEALAAAGGGLGLLFDGPMLVVCPPGVSKAHGVRRVLGRFGVSPHGVAFLGRNDRDLFDVGGFRLCPADAAPEVRRRADWVVPERGAAAIARAILGVSTGALTEAAAGPRVILGWAPETAEIVSIPATGVNVLIQGDSLSGKSWLAGGLVERLLAQRYAVCVVDVEGDYRVLTGLPGVVSVAVGDAAAWLGIVEAYERDPAAGIVADLSLLPDGDKRAAVEAGLRTLRALRGRLGLPHWLVLDEAHYFLGEDGVPDDALGLEEGGVCLVTYRASWIRDGVLAATGVFLLGQITDAAELAHLGERLARAATPDPRALAVAPALPRGEFLLVQREPAAERRALTFVAAPRETSHVRHRRKYADRPVAPGERFVFRRPDGAAVAVVESLGAFLDAVRRLDDEVLAFHAGRRDFSRWVFDVFGDADLGLQLRKIESRWQRGEFRDVRDVIARAVGARYGPAPRRAA